MDMPPKPRVILFILLLTAASLNAAASLDGERFRFSAHPRWANSGAWSGDELLVVDALYSRTMRFTDAGQFLGNISNKISAKPSIVNALPNGELLLENEAEDGYLVEFRATAKSPQAIYPLLEASGKRATQKIVGVYGWVALAENSLLVVGDVLDGDQGYSAFMRVNLKPQLEFEVMQRMEVSDPARRFYLLGYNYLAAVDGKPYYLVMGENPHIVRPTGSPLRLLQVTQDGRKPLARPRLPDVRGMDAAEPLFRALEEVFLPVGLYGWRGQLYVLMRIPQGGDRQWSLLKVDPNAGKILWQRPINARANHISVVPGDRYWAFIEKGPVTGPGQQRIASFLRIPAEEFSR